MTAKGAVGIPIDVLLVEDSPAEVRLAEMAFRDVNKSVRLHFASDGMEAMAFLNQEGEHKHARLPDLILLDLNLPRMDGREVLARIKRDPRLKTIPTIILTTSDEPLDVAQCYDQHSNCYLRKPGDWEMFLRMVRSINDFWLTQVTLLRQNEGS